MAPYKVLLTTSGTGSRLGELTRNTNKALVPIGGRAAISYILDSYAKNIPVVVTLGYLGDQVKSFLVRNYPDRHFDFVTVEPFVGEGSSLLYSMRCAKGVLQCPFVFHACDTIVIEKVPEPTEDWVAGYIVDPATVDITQYRSHRVAEGYLLEVQDKGAAHFDSIHIGMTGVKNYELFWNTVEELYQTDPHNEALGDVPVIERMMAHGAKLKRVPFRHWLDTGNLSALKETEKFLGAFQKRQGA